MYVNTKLGSMCALQVFNYQQQVAGGIKAEWPSSPPKTCRHGWSTSAANMAMAPGLISTLVIWPVAFSGEGKLGLQLQQCVAWSWLLTIKMRFQTWHVVGACCCFTVCVVLVL